MSYFDMRDAELPEPRCIACGAIVRLNGTVCAPHVRVGTQDRCPGSGEPPFYANECS